MEGDNEQGVLYGPLVLDDEYVNSGTTVISFLEHALGKIINLDAPALIYKEQQFTFRWLHHTSEAVAAALKERINPNASAAAADNKLIGVCASACEKTIAILLAILKLGWTYVLFDESYPPARIKTICDGCGFRYAISDEVSPVRSAFDRQQVNVLQIHELFEQAAEHLSTSKIVSVGTPAQNVVAALLYTSGSSGTPKGVQITHRNILNRLRWQWAQFPFKMTEVCCWKTSLTFVDSIAEIFAPLLQGVPLVILPKAIASNPHTLILALYQYKVTRLILVPSLLKAIITTISCRVSLQSDRLQANQQLLQALRLWVCSGEPLSLELTTEFFKTFTQGTMLANFYGSTEIMGDVTCATFDSVRDVIQKQSLDGYLPIGDAIVDNTIIYLVDPNTKQLVNDESVGEIWITGRNVTAGYFNNGEISSKFQHNPFSSTDSQSDKVVFCTGDFGIVMNKMLYYKGRVDSQIKVRGQRVSLLEVQSVISSNLSYLVSKVCVLCYHHGAIDQALVAFIIQKGVTVTTKHDLRQEIQKYLRACEVPDVNILFSATDFPMLVNGKIDRQRLLTMYEEDRRQAEKKFESKRKEEIETNGLEQRLPKTEMTRILVNVISDVTGTPCRDIANNLQSSFYILGGNSLNSVAVVVRLWQFGLHIEIGEFISAHSLQNIIDRLKPMSTPISPLLPPDSDSWCTSSESIPKYFCRSIQDQDRQMVIDILCTSFTEKGDLEQYTGVNYEDYEKYINSIWDDAIVNNNLCFVCVQPVDAKVIGVSFNFDYFDLCNLNPWQASEGIAKVFELIQFVEYSIRSKLCYPIFRGQILRSSLASTASSLDHAQNVHVMELMSKYLMKLAMSAGYDSVLSINTSILTQQIDRDVLEFETLLEYQVNQYVADDGTKPFETAPDSQAVICSLMRLHHSV